MIKVAAIPPPIRAGMVADWREKLNYDAQSKVAAWGLQVSSSN